MTPAMPMIAGGIGSVISATMTVANSAKYRQASIDSPAGTGASAIAAPMTSGHDRTVESVTSGPPCFAGGPTVCVRSACCKRGSHP